MWTSRSTHGVPSGAIISPLTDVVCAAAIVASKRAMAGILQIGINRLIRASPLHRDAGIHYHATSAALRCRFFFFSKERFRFPLNFKAPVRGQHSAWLTL